MTAIEAYLEPFLIGRDPDDIEDICQAAYVSSYWRSGPVLNNALAGVDMALWDIKGKRAGMPVYQLLGGKARHGADCLSARAPGPGTPPRRRRARKAMEQGYRHVRVQVAMPGYVGLRQAAHARTVPDGRSTASGRAAQHRAAIREPGPYVRLVPKLFEHMRTQLGDEVELLHDVHERVPPIQAIQLARDLEPYRLFFPRRTRFSPEDVGYFRTAAARRRRSRWASCSTIRTSTCR